MLQWVRADLGITIGTGVSAWADQSGNGHHFSQATGSAQPTYTAVDATLYSQASLSAIAPSSQQLVNTTLPVTPGMWASGVGKEIARSNAALWGQRVGQPESLDLFDSSGTGVVFTYNGSSLSSGITLPLNTWQRFEAWYNTNLTPNTAYCKVGGVAGTLGNTGTNTATGTTIFSTLGTAFWTGSIAERVVCLGQPTSAEIAALDAYYVARYGVDVVYGNPVSIFGQANVLQWCRADRGITLGTGVSAWADQSSGAKHYSQATGSQQPVYNTSDSTLGGQPTITFDGVDDGLSNATFTLPAPATTPTYVLCIWKIINPQTNNQVFGDAANGAVVALIKDTGNAVRNQAGAVGASVAFTPGVWYRSYSQFTGSASDVLKVGSASSTGQAGNNTAPGRALGKSLSNFPCNMSLYEIVYLSAQPTAPQLAAYDAYVTALTNGTVQL